MLGAYSSSRPFAVRHWFRSSFRSSGYAFAICMQHAKIIGKSIQKHGFTAFYLCAVLLPLESCTVTHLLLSSPLIFEKGLKLSHAFTSKFTNLNY